jgi:hypothetical protein
MGVMTGVMSLLFGGGANVVKDTVEVFRENAEASAVRQADFQNAALGQFAGEFLVPRTGFFDRFMDAVNRLPRPAMALGTLGLFVSAMVDPIWFSSRMQGISLVPEPLWWLLGAIVSFYFGARHQMKGQEFQRSIAQTLSRTQDVSRNLGTLQALDNSFGSAKVHGPGDVDLPDTGATGDNPALNDWRQRDVT